MTALRFYDGIRLVATRSAISCSRLFVAYTLDKWRAAIVVDTAVLVVDELVTHAVNATGVREERAYWTELTRIEFITVHLLGLEASIRIEVWDSAPNPPALTPEADATIRMRLLPRSPRQGCLGLSYRSFPIALGSVLLFILCPRNEDESSPTPNPIFSAEFETG